MSERRIRAVGCGGRFIAWSGWLLLLAVCGARVALAQAEVPVRPVRSGGTLQSISVGGSVPASAATVLTETAARAAVIFVGQVVRVDRQDEAGFVDVQFHVSQPVRGCTSNETYVLREWAGLWSGRPARYRVGQRLLMLLAARGPSGMSAPVNGVAGMIPLRPASEPPLVRGAGVAPPDTPGVAAELAVDLSWVETLAVRQVGLPAQPARGSVPPAGTDWHGPIRAFPRTVAIGGSQGTSLSAVLALLGNRSGLIATPAGER